MICWICCCWFRCWNGVSSVYTVCSASLIKIGDMMCVTSFISIRLATYGRTSSNVEHTRFSLVIASPCQWMCDTLSLFLAPFALLVQLYPIARAQSDQWNKCVQAGALFVCDRLTELHANPDYGEVCLAVCPQFRKSCRSWRVVPPLRMRMCIGTDLLNAAAILLYDIWHWEHTHTLSETHCHSHRINNAQPTIPTIILFCCCRNWYESMRASVCPFTYILLCVCSNKCRFVVFFSSLK